MRGRELFELLREFLGHHSTCGIYRCVACGQVHESELHYVATVDSHRFTALPCDCGLQEALTQWEMSRRR
jgi:hypothetical protein